MDAETLNQIFIPYFTTKKPNRGTGLGLCIVPQIVKKHKGGLTVWSEPGKGTIFQAYFPIMEGKLHER